MTQININFTYNLADDYLAQTNDLGKTNEWTYVGPDRIWVFINNDNNKVGDFSFLTEENNGPEYPTPEGYTKVEINCALNPLLATLLNANSYFVDQNELEQLEIQLPNGNTYSRPRNPDPNHTYEAEEITYENNDWIIPWKKPWITWNDLYKIRDHWLQEAELELSTVVTLPDSLRTKLNDYINSLKNLETEWANFEPYMYILPDYPL